MSDAPPKTSGAKRQGRSPSYPSIPLSLALAKAQAQYEKEGKYAAPLPSAFKAWGYSHKSSGGRDVRASLRYFGLVSFEGDGDTAKVKLTEDALRVITDKREDQTEKNSIIRRLALNPAIHKKLVVRYPEGIKSDATAVHYLVWEEGYNESAAEALLAVFKQTAAFARLYEPDESSDNDEFREDEKPRVAVEIGDLVNVERGGALVFPSPVKVTAIEEHSGQTWVWTEGSEAWTEIETVTVEAKGGSTLPKVPPPRPPGPPVSNGAGISILGTEAGVLEEKFNIDDGVVVVRYPAKMTTASVNDLEEFLELFIKKAKRRATIN